MPTAELPVGVQRVSPDVPIDYIVRLLKRDGGVFVQGLVSEKDVDQATEDCRERMDNDREWDGAFFPSRSRDPLVLASR